MLLCRAEVRCSNGFSGLNGVTINSQKERFSMFGDSHNGRRFRDPSGIRHPIVIRHDPPPIVEGFQPTSLWVLVLIYVVAIALPVGAAIWLLVQIFSVRRHPVLSPS
jgi:hypothetical protein